MKKSKMVTFIGGFYILGGFVLLLSLFFGGSPINNIFGLPNISDYIVKPIIAIIFIPLGYLYMKRIKYSNIAMLLCAAIFFCISADLTTKLNEQPYIGNMIYSLFVLIVTLVRRKEFIYPVKAIFKNDKYDFTQETSSKKQGENDNNI